MSLVSQFIAKKDYTIGRYLYNFLNNIKFYFNTFFIQYEKFVFHHMYGIFPDSDNDSETNEYDIVENEESEDEDEYEEEEEENSENEGSSEEESEDDEDEFCKENCQCKLCFYFKDVVENVYHKLKDKQI